MPTLRRRVVTVPHGLAMVACFAVLGTSRPIAAESALGEPEEHIIRYENSDKLADPVATLQGILTNGKARLSFESGQGYLRSLLDLLNIPVSSQVLVFSKTSSQSDHISSRTPRAIYFNSNTYIAWAPDASEIDLASVDPNLGPIFYTLQQAPVARPQFLRRDDCLRCHLGAKTLNVPGLLIKSTYTASDGTVIRPVPDFVSGHNSPLELRWGGWYVTGTHSGATHLGNIFLESPSNIARLDVSTGANLTDLGQRFDKQRYLSADSDIVALLVLEHQVRMQNLITHANYETRYALEQKGNLSTSDWPGERIATAGEMLLEYMLFRDEALLSGEVKGTSRFAAEFEGSGLLADDNRSLRRLDLHTRLFRYSCSFLIYSQAFDALPTQMKCYLWARLQKILTGQDRRPTYSTLSSDQRQNLLEILCQTKPEFAAWLVTSGERAASER